jgi:hypothetical protein
MRTTSSTRTRTTSSRPPDAPPHADALPHAPPPLTLSPHAASRGSLTLAPPPDVPLRADGPQPVGRLGGAAAPPRWRARRPPRACTLRGGLLLAAGLVGGLLASPLRGGGFLACALLGGGPLPGALLGLATGLRGGLAACQLLRDQGLPLLVETALLERRRAPPRPRGRTAARELLLELVEGGLQRLDRGLDLVGPLAACASSSARRSSAPTIASVSRPAPRGRSAGRRSPAAGSRSWRRPRSGCRSPSRWRARGSGHPSCAGAARGRWRPPRGRRPPRSAARARRPRRRARPRPPRAPRPRRCRPRRPG